MHHFNKNMKLLLIVREPVERMVSHLVHIHGTRMRWRGLQDKVLVETEKGPIFRNQSHMIQLSRYYE